MKTLLVILMLALSTPALSQGYYDYFPPKQPNSQRDIRDQIMERQQNFTRNQIEQGMRELEVRSNIRRYDMINGGSGNIDYNYGSGRYDRY